MLQEHKLVDEMKLVIALIVVLVTVLPVHAKDSTISTALSEAIMTKGIVRKDLPIPHYLQKPEQWVLIQYGKYIGEENLYLCGFLEPEKRYRKIVPHCIGTSEPDK